MTTNESLAKFKEKIDALVNAKYLFAERRISDVLKAIAESRILYELFEYVTDGFDYKTFKSVCFISGGGVKLPKRDEDLLALCFLLLIEIDGERESLDDICSKCFDDVSSAQAKYSEFVVSVIIPFATATENVIDKMMDAKQSKTQNEQNENIVSVDNFDNNEQLADGKNVSKKGIIKHKFILEEIEKVKKVNKKKLAEAKEEALYILTSFDKALAAKDAQTVTLAFTALKNFAKVEKSFKLDLNKLSNGMIEALGGEL